MNIRAYRDMNNAQTIEEFRRALFREHGVMETIDMMRLFQEAWRRGFEGGYEEVYYHFVDLLDMHEGVTSQI